MKIKTTQRDIRSLIKSGEAFSLSVAKSLIDAGERKYHDFDQVLYSVGVYGINGLAIVDTTDGQMYADAARTTNVFYFA